MQREFTLLLPAEFLEHFRREASVAKKRVWAQVMFMTPGYKSGQIEESLVDAATRGVDTILHVDSFSDMVTDETFLGGVWGNLLLSADKAKQKQFNKKDEKATEMFLRLQKRGIAVVKTNPPNVFEKNLPMIGRDHRKFTIIDDVAYIGGMNFTDEELEMPDFMVRVTKPEVVEALASEFQKINELGSKENTQSVCDLENTLLTDSGKTGRSIILDTATALIRKAKKMVRAIFYIFPEGKLLKSIHGVYRRGIDVEMITSNPAKVKGLFFVVNKKNEFFMRGKEFPIFLHPAWIHAKMLIVDDTVFVGSHNFSESGVRARTKEIVLVSKDKDLLSQAIAFYNSLRRECKPNHLTTSLVQN